MSVAEFDAWISGRTNGGYRATTADELSERTQFEALREILAERRASRRLETVIELSKADCSSVDEPEWDNFQSRLDEANQRIRQLEIFLRSPGPRVVERPTA